MDTNLANNTSGIEKRRLQFDFSAETIERVEAMKKAVGATTYAQVVNNALRLYEWFLAQQREGRTIMVREGKKVKEIEFMF